MTTDTRTFALPDLGEGLTESEVVAWRVAVGDRVELNQVVADVETAKAVVEIPSPFAGVITALHAEPGQVVQVGGALFSCDVGARADVPGESEPARERVAGEQVVQDAAAQDEAPAREPTLVGWGAGPERAPRRRPRREGFAGGASAPGPASPGPASPPDRGSTERPRSTPPVRRLARELGVDLAAISGTGERGLVTRADVEAAAHVGAGASVSAPARRDAAAAPGEAPSGTAADGSRVVRRPIRGVRRHTADAMVRSAFTAPHATVFLTVDVTGSIELLERMRGDRALDGHRIGILALTARALCIALRRHPELNAHWDEEAGEIVEYGYVHLGIAAATGRGLVVPNVPDADALGLADLADAIAELAETARAGRTTPERLAGGTITITNVGVFGVDAGTPILNPGEAAILALGAVRREPREHDGGIALRDVVTLSLSFDHRLVDGRQASGFLADVGAILRDPGYAMAIA